MIPLLAALATAGAIVLFGWQLSRGRQSRPTCPSRLSDSIGTTSSVSATAPERAGW